jgi:nucleoside-diphosphate-sugar epimerase
MSSELKLFMAGATGILGRRTVPLLVAAGHRGTAVARRAEKEAALAAVGAEPVRVDLFDARAVASAVRGHDVVINLATHIPPSSRAVLPWAWRENDRVRREISRNLADAALAARVRRLIQESFAPTYASGGDAWLTEASPIHPARQSRSALDAERAAKGFGGGGRAAVVLRFAFFHDAESGTTQDTLRFARKGWASTFGAADGFVSSIMVEDAARAVLAALEVPAGIYNVSDDEPLRRREYFEALGAALGVATPKLPPAWLAHLAGPVGEMLARSQRVSNQKLREASGWRPRAASMREGWRSGVGEGVAGDRGRAPHPR